ncbi:methylcrotonoyl-CoA carboxylase subunit alpha, mitochondrial [Schistocerca serialis cubense]|uniref:methylcrotonoyl-CoA carboxylase subunit alpha, mitochondrial n=1 Tax=Schistocerca serialis cubense TaxID=2023355 RepID=UPI00214F1F1B|nr:methylcrotonoyl-CoA carboxylase subunit alpha, mitochondrial [Schistocerca serialis cubense]
MYKINVSLACLLFGKAHIKQGFIHHRQKCCHYSSGLNKHIEKILIANRGEIACRVMRTAKKLGIKTVAVYSDADAAALHVSMADDAYNIGPAPSQESYLRQDKIIQIAKSTGCQAIHPGYGFLSENTEFANLCQKSDIIFIGPPATAIRDMGIKSTSKSIMAAAGVPVVEGYHGNDQSLDKLQKEAERIGFPVMIKAVRGGGGKGMRIAFSPNEFESELESAKREAMKSFGDEAMLLEKFIQEPRHVEVQIFGDKHGNYVHLFERDCSVQRRHQKIIEEAPAPGISDMLRMELGAAAVRAAQAVGYVGAGTVEFILDRHNHSFHFMEMNTRLQVEHPITEMITDTDLVEWQIKVAGGEELPLKQDEIKLNGHAFEARIYAENPNNNFLPGAGPLLYLSTPVPETDVRVETGVRQGDEVSVHYDPMIAKLVVWGKNRREALMKLRSQLSSYYIAGLDTNVNFLLDLSKHEAFIDGQVHTNFIEEHRNQLLTDQNTMPSDELILQAFLAQLLKEKELAVKSVCNSNNPFATEVGFRLNHLLKRTEILSCPGIESVAADITYNRDKSYLIKIKGNEKEYTINGELTKSGDSFDLSCSIDGHVIKSHIFFCESDIYIFTKDGSQKFNIPLPKYMKELEEMSSGVSGSNAATAPMPGVIDKVWVSEGQTVEVGQPLMIIIAMKMEYSVRAPLAGKIEKVLFKQGDSVSKNAVLVKFEETDSNA